MYGREKLKTYTSCELYDKNSDEFKAGEAFLKEESDKVMDAMEQRIKELEADAELDQKKRLMLCNGYNKKCERVKELEEENAKLHCLVLHAMSYAVVSLTSNTNKFKPFRLFVKYNDAYRKAKAELKEKK